MEKKGITLVPVNILENIIRNAIEDHMSNNDLT